MAKRPTPIERAIAGEPIDVKERYARNLTRRGLTRVSLTVPASRADELRALARDWRLQHERRDDD